MAVIGWFGSDLVDDVGNSLGDAWNAAVDAVPGARDVADAVDSVVSGPVRDFAHSAVGRTLLTALASSVTGGLAPLLGPQLATVAFAIPGLAAGDDFVTAWTQEFASRVNQTAQILGAGEVPPEWTSQLDKAKDFIASSGVDLSGIDFHDLAKRAGIREDVAAWLVAGATSSLVDYERHAFDPKTGKDLGILETPFEKLRRLADAQARAALLAYVRSVARGTEIRTATIATFTQAHGGTLTELVYGSAPSSAPSTAAVAAHAAAVSALATPPPSTATKVAVAGGIGVGALLLAWFFL